MPKYQLKITFDPISLPTLYDCEERLVIVKQTADESRVAWVAFDPLLNNTILWEDHYALYCSNSSMQSGAVIDKLSDINASDGLYYDFGRGVFENPHQDESLSTNTYGIFNNQGGYSDLVFGLAQSVAVNGESHPNHPICAVRVPYKHSSTFTPFEKLEIYLEANKTESMVLTNTHSKPIVITFGGNDVNKHIVYNKQTGEFYELPSASL